VDGTRKEKNTWQWGGNGKKLMGQKDGLLCHSLFRDVIKCNLYQFHQESLSPF